MKVIRCAIILVLVLLTLCGCGATQAVRPATPAGGDQALVYLIRKKYPPYVHQLRLSSDGAPLATLKNNDYVAVNLPVGKNKILADVTDGLDFTFAVDVERPEVMYIVLTGEVEGTGVTTEHNAVNVHLLTTLRSFRVTKAEAESIVAGFGKAL
jgi:hypothetical protein